jgi:light-regulated signal transduction histidine kinase (bacteriophytochrome)
MTERLKETTASRDELMMEVAERKRALEWLHESEENLKRHVSELAASNRELEAFSYSVSHDLRAPLRSLDGFSKALLEDYADKLDAEGRNYLERIIAAAQRMGQLIDDLLNLSRLTRVEMRRENVNLSGIAEKIAEGLKKANPERSARFIIAKGLSAYGDECLLQAVIENLLGNAWKFTEKTENACIEFGVMSQEIGEGAKKIPVPNSGHRTPNSQLVYYVRDNGAGFDKTYADKLFTPFQRLHNTKEFAGTGIGLATVKRIVNRHGGRVWIEGEPGKGAAVYFTL